MLSTLIMFSVIQGLYILRKDEDDSFEDEEYYEEPPKLPIVLGEKEEMHRLIRMRIIWIRIMMTMITRKKNASAVSRTRGWFVSVI